MLFRGALLGLAAVFMAITLSPASVVAVAQVFAVSKVEDTNDGACDADCSLREAVSAANLTPDKDTITFAIGSGAKTIALASTVAITQPVEINGLTQPGGATCTPRNLLITITSPAISLSVSGPVVPLAGSLLRGIAVSSVSLGANAGPTDIECSNLGADRFGTSSLGTTGNCLAIATTNAPVYIGGFNPDDRNVISGCSLSGISGTAGTNHLIRGNYIGLKYPGGTGNQSLKNSAHGISLGGGTDWNVIANVISGNGTTSSHHGLNITGAATAVVYANRIGTNVAGDDDLPNFGNGVNVSSAGVQIGGATAGQGNLISGNGSTSGSATASAGILLTGSNAVVQGNIIGFDFSGEQPLSNDNEGVSISASNVLVGGTTPGARNVIYARNNIAILVKTTAGALTNIDILGNNINVGTNGLTPSNSGLGFEVITSGAGSVDDVTVGDGTPAGANIIRTNTGSPAAFLQGSITNVRFSGNSILALNETAIDLVGANDFPVRTTPNDALDADAGPNGLQNHPVLDAVPNSGSTISGVLDSAPNSNYRIEFFRNATKTGPTSCDAEGYGDGEQYLGFKDVTTGANGHVAFSHTLGVALNPGQSITASATTTAGSTSEFGPCVFVPGGALQANAISVDEAIAGALPFLLSLYGQGFTAANTIAWNGFSLPTTVVSPVELRVTVPEAVLGNSKGTANIQLMLNGTTVLNPFVFAIRRSTSDVNCDNAANALDALRTMRTLAGLEPPHPDCPGDAANDDGEVTVRDALFIRQDIAGLIEAQQSQFDP